MDTTQLWARNGDTVHQAIALGAFVPLDTASEELADELVLFAIASSVLSQWAKAFPAPRHEPQVGMEVLIASHRAARFAELYAMRTSGYVLRSTAVLGALGSRVAVLAPAQGLSWRGTADDQRISGAILRTLLVKRENHVDLHASVRLSPNACHCACGGPL